MNIWHLISVNISRIVKEFGEVWIKDKSCKGNKDNDRACMTGIYITGTTSWGRITTG